MPSLRWAGSTGGICSGGGLADIRPRLWAFVMIEPRDRAWSFDEVEATVADYLHMLALELSGQAFIKSAHRRQLRERLSQRSEAAIELKHQNISAVLIELGSPYIAGYKPRYNYQSLLFDVVAARLEVDAVFDRAAAFVTEQPATAPLLTADILSILVEPPAPKPLRAEEARSAYRVRKGIKRDYLAIEARNRSLGRAGEEFVAKFEAERLHRAGKKTLSDRVELVSVSQGDGLGYDILSFDADGRERFVEVKTTAFGRETPFFVTRNELEVSRQFATQYRVSRLFSFRRVPMLFELNGALDASCSLEPDSYLARFG